MEDNNWFTARWNTKTGWWSSIEKSEWKGEATKLWIGKMGIPSFRFFLLCFETFFCLPACLHLCASAQTNLYAPLWVINKSENIRNCRQVFPIPNSIHPWSCWLKKKSILECDAKKHNIWFAIVRRRSQPLAHCVNMSQHETRRNRNLLKVAFHL